MLSTRYHSAWGRGVFSRESLRIGEHLTLIAGQGVRELRQCYPDTHQFLAVSFPWYLQSSVCYAQSECQQLNGNLLSHVVLSLLVWWHETQRKNQLAQTQEDITEPMCPDLPR